MPDTDYPKAPDVAVETIFPMAQPAPAPHTFELALVLGGTVSAGCYTAGVLDFLLEALDAWAAAVAQDAIANPGAPTVPRHKVLIRVVSGTSGGGVNAVLLSRALNYSFSPAGIGATAAEKAKNPFYQVWVNAISIDGLLATDDLQGATAIPSLLSGKPLAAAAANAIAFTAGPPPPRQYVVTPLPVILTYSNVAGIPYQQQYLTPSGRAEYYVNHADYVRFGIEIATALPGGKYPLPPDTFKVGSGVNGVADVLAWSGMSNYALGTAAFPVGLPAVQVARPAGHYAYRYILPNDGQGSKNAQWLTPQWSLFVPPGADAGSKYSFVSVDGGCTDNTPIGLAHDSLAGISPTRETSGDTVNRAIVLVDPFSEVPQFAASPKTDLLSVLFPTVNCLVQNNRYNSADLTAFFGNDDFSRFLITPTGTNANGQPLAGGDAIASSGLSAFLGFFSKDYREHDFMLGRRNCQAFLKNWFSLPAGNPLFSAPMPAPVETPPGSGKHEIPIVPLYGSAAVEQRAPAVPGSFDPASLQTLIKARVDALLAIVTNVENFNWTYRWAVKLALGFVSSKATGWAVKAVQAAIQNSKLLTPK